MLGNLMLIVNPYSGRGLSKSALGTIVTQFCANGYAATVYTIGEYTAEELSYKYAKRHDICVCMGGDGTLNNVISGLLRAGTEIPVGYIPAGTSNDVATTLNLSKEPLAAAQTIIHGEPTPIDVGMFGEEYFTYIAAFGAFTNAAYSTPQTTKRSLGHFAYVLNGLADMGAITAHRTRVELDDEVIEGDYIFGGVINSTSIAGFVKLDPEYVDLADGLFEVILVKQPVSLADFLNILSSVKNRDYNREKVQMFQANKVKFTFETDVPWTIDGEDGGEHKQVEIINCHKAIEIIV